MKIIKVVICGSDLINSENTSEENGKTNSHKCKSCIEFDTNNNPDFTCIEALDGKVIKIDQIREMQVKVQEKPIISNNKVYIINNANLMRVEAQNCLLKTLEEPPEFVTIILVTANENELLSTIKSRCMILKFEPISNDDMKKYLDENYQIQPTESMLEMFQGSISKALELKDKNEMYEQIKELIENLNKRDLIGTLEKSQILYESKEEIQKILEYINTILLKLAKTNHSYAKGISIVENTKKRLKQNCNYDMSIDNMIWNLWREVN